MKLYIQPGRRVLLYILYSPQTQPAASTPHKHTVLIYFQGYLKFLGIHFIKGFLDWFVFNRLTLTKPMVLIAIVTVMATRSNVIVSNTTIIQFP